MNIGIDEQSKHKIIGIISVLLPESSIYLFGSRSRGTHLQWSDIDIALETKNSIVIMITGEIASMFEASNMPYKIQVVDINSVSEKMRENILKDRVIWKK
jgi:predicted nucleotidyltransferase